MFYKLSNYEFVGKLNNTYYYVLFIDLNVFRVREISRARYDHLVDGEPITRIGNSFTKTLAYVASVG